MGRERLSSGSVRNQTGSNDGYPFSSGVAWKNTFVILYIYMFFFNINRNHIVIKNKGDMVIDIPKVVMFHTPVCDTWVGTLQ